VTTEDDYARFQELLAALPAEQRDMWIQFSLNLLASEERRDYVVLTLMHRLLAVRNEPRAAAIVLKYRDDGMRGMSPTDIAEAEDEAQGMAESVVARHLRSL
jgi:hypothetical protein